MSGFVGIYNIDKKPIDTNVMNKMLYSLRYRGPDRQKMQIENEVGLGHALFKTTFEDEYDQQPYSLDGDVWIICSARIDDRQYLVNKLGIKNINLNKTADSKLILYAYRKWGEDCLDHLLGDFAFLIWDKKEQKIFCARDRFGMRQLYYSLIKNTLIIANNLYTMLQHPDISTNFNERAIGGFLLFANHNWLDKSMTFFDNVTSLLPAHKMVFTKGRISIKKYWDISLNIPLLHYKKESDYIEHFQEIFNTSILDRLRTSSVVVTMSGGMDSTSIAATLRQLQKYQQIPPFNVQAVTAVYNKLMPCQERYYSGLVKDKLNIPIHYLAGDNYPFLDFGSVTTAPTMHPAPAFTLDIKKTVSSYSRVVFSGASADNLLSFSPVKYALSEKSLIYMLNNVYHMYKRYGSIPPFGMGIMRKMKFWNKKSNNFNAYHYPAWLNPEFAERLDIKEYVENFFELQFSDLNPRHPYAHDALVTPNWNTDDTILNPNFTQAEVRDPFLDTRLIEFVFSLPSLPWFFKKHLLRESMKNLLPDEIIERPKTVLGNLLGATMNNNQNRIREQDKSIHNLSTYVNYDKIAPYTKDNNLFLNARPLFLSAWIKEIDKLSFDTSD